MAARLHPLLEHVHRLAARLDPEADAVLLERFVRQRDSTAFEALVYRHGAMVLSVCRRVLGNVHDAEDVFQATFLVLARKAADIRPASSLPAWLHGTAHRLALKQRQTQKRRQNRETRRAQTAETPPPSDPLDQLTAREMLQALDEELQRLPEVNRLPLILCCLEGRTQDEAAEMLGWTPDSVRGRLHRGRALLHDRLARRGLALGAGLLAAVALGQNVKAALSATLTRTTVEAAVSLAAGGQVGVAAGVLALADGAMRMTGLKVWALLLGVGLLVSAGGLLARQIGAREESGPPLRVEAPPSSAANPARAEAAVRVDRHGDPLPLGALTRLGTVRLRHNIWVRSLIFTPDGKGVITAGGDNLPRLWDRASGKLIREFSTIPKPQIVGNGYYEVFGAVLSPDGRILAARSGQKRSLYLLETATGKLLREFPCDGGDYSGHTAPANFAFCPDGKTIAAQLNGNLELREVATGRTLWRQEEEKQDVVSLAFSPDGKTVASGSRAGVRLWDARTGKPARDLDSKEGTNCVAFSPDGRMLAVGCESSKDREHDSVHLWDVGTGREIRTLGENESILFFAFSLDGKTIATAGAGGICQWEIATGKELRRSKDSLYSLGPLAFSPDGKLLAMIDGLLVRFWEAASGKALSSRLPTGHESGVNSLAFTPDGQTLVSAAGDGTVRWWNTRTGQQRLCLHNSKSWITWAWGGGPKAVLSPDGRIVAASCLEAPDGERPWDEMLKGFRCSIRLWDSATGKELRRLDREQDWSNQLVFSPDGKWLADGFVPSGGNSPSVSLWEVATGKRCERSFGGRMPVFSPKGNLLATVEGDTNSVISFWEVATGKKIQFLSMQESIQCLALSPDGQMLATGSDKITLYPVSWDKHTGVQVGVARPVAYPPHWAVTNLTFSPDGRMLASSGSDHTVHLWETASGKERARFQGHNIGTTDHTPGVAPLSFSADGRRLASGGADSTILIWDVAGQLQPAKLSDKELKSLWADLASDDAARAGRAIRALIAAGTQASLLLGEQLRPVAPKAAPEVVAGLIADLDSENFQARQKAQGELEKLGELCEPELRQALGKRPALEMRRRLEELVSKLNEARKNPPGDRLRIVRAVEVLEQVGTPDARRVLEGWSRGAPGAHLTREAQAALERLNRKQPG